MAFSLDWHVIDLFTRERFAINSTSPCLLRLRTCWSTLDSKRLVSFYIFHSFYFFYLPSLFLFFCPPLFVLLPVRIRCIEALRRKKARETSSALLLPIVSVADVVWECACTCVCVPDNGALKTCVTTVNGGGRVLTVSDRFHGSVAIWGYKWCEEITS